MPRTLLLIAAGSSAVRSSGRRPSGRCVPTSPEAKRIRAVSLPSFAVLNRTVNAAVAPKTTPVRAAPSQCPASASSAKPPTTLRIAPAGEFIPPRATESAPRVGDGGAGAATIGATSVLVIETGHRPARERAGQPDTAGEPARRR